jgi:hypothetical protein
MNSENTDYKGFQQREQLHILDYKLEIYFLLKECKKPDIV